MSDIVRPENDHDVVLLVAEKIDNLCDDFEEIKQKISDTQEQSIRGRAETNRNLQDIKISMSEMATKKYVDDRIQNVNDRLQPLLNENPKHARSSSGNPIVSFLTSALFRYVLLVLTALLLTLTISITSANQTSQMQQIDKGLTSLLNVMESKV